MRVVLWAVFSIVVVSCWLFAEYVILVFIGAIIRKPIACNLFDRVAWRKHYIVNTAIALLTFAFSVMVFCTAFRYAAEGMPEDDADIRMLEKDWDQEHREPVL